MDGRSCIWPSGLALYALSGLVSCGHTASVRQPTTCNALDAIRFSEHLCPRLAADTKRITLRSRHRVQIRSGQWVQLVCMKSNRRFLARITSVRHATWRTITAQELGDDGFSDGRRMLRIMRRYYPGVGWDDPATVYRWDRSRSCPGRSPATSPRAP